jgi:hypothetical protein
MAPRRSWTKANNLYWSTQEAEEYCRRRKLSIVTFKRWARHLVSPEDLRKRVEHLRKLRWNEVEQQDKKKQPKRRRRRARALSLQRAHGQRSDRSSGVLEHACRSAELERHGARRNMPRLLVFRPMHCAYGAIVSKTSATKWIGDPCFIRVPGLN